MNRKMALITGATGGLGTEFAKLHAATGGNLLLVARNKEKLEEMKKSLEASYHIKVKTFLADLSAEDAAALVPGPLQAEYCATKAYVTSLSNVVWQELKGTGVTVTALMPGAMNTGFISASDMENTPLFAHPVSPANVAKKGYEGMLKGKVNVISGLLGWQKIFMALLPMFPKKVVLKIIYRMQ